jgi:pimeloyl-ACP methyl ester carboxylesterase
VVRQAPPGFTEHKAKVGSLGIDYVIGGHGPTLVLIHGYPQTWYEWRNIMPAHAKHYTVIGPRPARRGQQRRTGQARGLRQEEHGR